MPAHNSKLRVLVVDDSALYRKIVGSVFSELPDVELVGTATDGEVALRKIEELRPDVLTVDLEMPNLDGIGLLREIAKRKLNVTCIMVSSFTAKGAEATTTALELGAFDFVLKPQTKSVDESLELLRRELRPKLDACREQRRRIDGPPSRNSAGNSAGKTATAGIPKTSTGGLGNSPVDIIAIGVSTGGPQALCKVLPLLPADLSVPVLIVQHMPPMFTKSLADDLNRKSRVEVHEAADGDVVLPGHVYIAPGGKQTKVLRIGNRAVIRTSDDPPEKNCRPAVDYLFRSVAQGYGASALAIVLTGMGDDGTEGAKVLRKAGAKIIAQDEASCTVYGMPRQIIENGLADLVLPLDEVAKTIVAKTITSLSRKEVLV